MSQLTVDSAVAAQFESLENHVEIVDPSGRVLGTFFPKLDLSDWEPTEPFLSEEELEKRFNSTGKRFTTAEVLARLEKL